MRSLTRELEPVKLHESSWQREVLSVPVVYRDESYEFLGEALFSPSGTAHQVEFEFSSSCFRPAEIRIALGVTSSALAEIFIAGQPVCTSTLEASTDSILLINLLKVDVSEWSEARAKTPVRLRVSYKQQTGKTTILLDGAPADFQSRVIQNWSRSCFLQASLYFALAWAVILGIALVTIANATPLGTSFGIYALGTAVVAWTAGVLGLPDLARIPVRPWLRRIYSRTKRHRTLALVGLFVLFTGVSVSAGLIAYSRYTRDRYETLIKQAIKDLASDDTTALRQAFALLPWRKEAQFLFEKQAFSRRSEGNPTRFRNLVSGFVSDAHVVATVERLRQQDSFPFCLTRDSEAIADPVIWYASILPEAEEGFQTERKMQAVDILSAKAGPEARLLRLSIEIEVYASDRDKMFALAKSLQAALPAKDIESALSGFALQVAHDKVGQCSIIECGPSSAKDAIRSFRAVLEFRANNTRALWGRPPQKLMLYHIFQAYVRSERQKADAANEARVATSVQEQNADGFLKYCEFEELFGELVKEYPAFRDKDVWKKGTVLDESKSSYVENTLITLGWRY